MEIKIATTMEELKKIGALRYDVYVREQQTAQFFADETTGLLLEPVDAFNESAVIYAQENEEIVASIRIEYRIPDWLLFQLNPIPGGFFSLKGALASRAFSTYTARGSRYFDALILWIAENILVKKYEMVLLTCHPQLIDLYLAYGYQSSGHVVNHPLLGTLGTLPLLVFLACSDGVQKTRMRFLAGRFQHELSTERKSELYRWLKL